MALFMKEATDVLLFYKVSNCPINNRIHRDILPCAANPSIGSSSSLSMSTTKTPNCCIFEDNSDGSKWHVYLTHPIHFTQTGDPVCSIVESNRYLIKHYLDSNLKMLFTKLPDLLGDGSTLKALEHIATNGRVLRTFIASQLDYYQKNIYPIITPYNICPMQIFDIFNGENDIGRGMFSPIAFRPVTLISDPCDYLDRKRRVFCELLRLYTESEECADRYLSAGLKIKDRLHCSASRFTQSRQVPIELLCSYGAREKCRHVRETEPMMTAAHGLPARPTVLCQYVLEKYLEQYDDAMVSETFGFTCIFREMDTFNEIQKLVKRPPLMFAFNALYGRKTVIHRLCLPAYILNSTWSKWFDNILEC